MTLTRYRGKTGDDVIEDPTGDLVFYDEVRAVLTEVETWLKEFIEWNACNLKEGTYRCNQCEVASPSGHLEDCDIVTAQQLLTRLQEIAP